MQLEDDFHRYTPSPGMSDDDKAILAHYGWIPAAEPCTDLEAAPKTPRKRDAYDWFCLTVAVVLLSVLALGIITGWKP